MNNALLRKWLWTFSVEKDSFWQKVIVTKYGTIGMGWDSKFLQGVYDSGL